MAFIGAGMHRYPIGTKLLYIYGCFGDIGVAAAAAVAERCYFINVYT
jgi:hypothetical protein